MASSQVAATALPISPEELSYGDDPNERDERLEQIERADTVETTDQNELMTFVQNVQSLELGEGQRLLELLRTLPRVNSVCGKMGTIGCYLFFLERVAAD